MKTIRHLHLVGATGQIRTATYDNREHLVVPVVAMVEGVVWAVNSDVPEFVPAEELAETPHQWNGRGCFAGHPEDGGTQVTANTPRTLERSFGLVFDTSSHDRILQTRRLELSAWLDPSKAEALGPDSANVIRRLKAGEVVEVSVGCYVEAEDVDGEFNGKAYHGVWRNIVSDHLAFLGTGEKGACSVAAGCGAGRMATRHLVTAEGIRREEDMKEPGTGHRPAPPPGAKRTIAQRIAAFMSSLRDSEGNSDIDVRRALDDALRAVEPGFQGVSEVYPESSEVIYYVMPGDEWMMKRRNYTMTDGGIATLTDNAVEVEPVTTYEVVMAAVSKQPAVHNGGRTAEKEISMKSTEAITALTGCPCSGFTTADAKALEGFSEERLTALVEQSSARKAALDAAEKTKPVEEPKVAAAKAMTRDEMLAAMPDVKVMLDERVARELAQKTELVTSLKTAAASAYTEAELNAMDVTQLSKLATLAKVETIDFSGRGAATPPRTPRAAETFVPPNPYDAELGVKATVQ